MDILKIKTAIACCVFLLSTCHQGTATSASASASAPPAHITTSLQQGMHQWPAFDGKLVLVAGTSTDTLKYKRSLTFYFVEKSGAEWLHVPIVQDEANFTLTWLSISTGETTVADAVVALHDRQPYLILARRNAKSAAIDMRTFKFAQSGDDFPDGPAYLFKPVATNTYQQKTMSVEDALKKEAQRKPTK